MLYLINYENKNQDYLIDMRFLPLSKRHQLRITYRKNGIHWKDNDVTHSIGESIKQPNCLRAESSES